MADKYGPQRKYMAANIKRISIDFHRRNDADLIGKLDTVPNKSGYIKGLIREDIKRDKGEQ